VTQSGSITTTTTYVAGGLEEIAANGVGTTLTKYFMGANGLPTAERVGTNGPLAYLASDGQGTVSEALDSGGTVTFAQLYTPYGNVRYSSGSSPTTLGYTGQRADSATGLDYYQARYYDPVAGQFASADTINDGLNRYGYVRGNPETATDPTGHYQCFDDPCTRGGGRSSATTPPPPPPHCTSDANCSIGKTITCTPTSLDTDCANYVQTYTYDLKARQDYLSGLNQRAAQKILIGSLLAAGIDLAELIWETKSIVSKVVNGIELLGDVSAALTWAPAAFGHNQPSPEIANIAGWIHAALGALRSLVAIIRVGGWFLQAALDAGWIVATGLLKGLPGLLMTVAALFVGSTILDAASTVVHGITAVGYNTLTTRNR
jgi:RHS repeat-associated protein